MIEALFKQALDIESPWFIENMAFDVEKKRLDIWLDFERGSRFELEDDEGVVNTYPAYDTEKKTWRHLNFFQHECYLHARVPRVKNKEGRVLMVLPPWSGKMLGFTLLFEALLLQLCKHMPVHQVAKMTGVSDFKLWRMVELYVDAARHDDDYSGITAVGMDETSVARGHHYITLFVDMLARRTLFVTEGKDSATVQAFVEDLKEHQGTSEQIADVSCDMSPAFIKDVQEALPNAKITFDKFHILKIINVAVDAVRREEAKTNPLLKGMRYVFLKNDQNLTEKQRAQKEALQIEHLNLKTMDAMRMRESFQQLYHLDSHASFVAALTQWVDWVKKCGLAAMEKTAQMVQAHWDGIVQWKKSQLNNGILEGLNSIVQAAKRKARGYKPKHFATIAYLLTGKLNFTKVNPHYLPT